MALVDHLAPSQQSLPLIENARGGAGNDVLTGNRANNILHSGQGSNALNGREGNDFLISEGIFDRLDGGAGNDALINFALDGDTHYVFARGYGHDGILDNPASSSNIDITLDGLTPDDIRFQAVRYDLNRDLPPDQQRSEETRWQTGLAVIEIISTGESLVTPWYYRPPVMRNDPIFATYWDYSLDSIEFSNGVVWGMQYLEQYATWVEVDHPDIWSTNPDHFAWMTEDLAPEIAP